MNRPLNTDPAEGSREVVDLQLKRQEREQNRVDHLAGVEVSGQPQGGAVDRARREDRVRTRAHHLWERAGKPQGEDEQFWHWAEREVGPPEPG